MKTNKIVEWGLKIVTFIILLEPVWMLLPFAGFLYGSLLNLEFLKDHWYSVWLLYFIFPVQTLLPVAMGLSVIGFAIFIFGAFQIYTAKLRKAGLVKTGIYKKFRHPQYTGLMFFCIGFLLAWGRFITYILFFTMLYLYFLLARKEEAECLKQFGKDYEDYRENTWFIFPGDIVFTWLGEKFSVILPHRMVRGLVSFVLMMMIGIGSCFGILAVREASMTSVPFVRTTIADVNGKNVDMILLEGFGHNYRRINRLQSRQFDYSQRYQTIAKKLSDSSKLKRVLATDTSDMNTLFGFAISRTVREKKPYYNQGKFDLYILQMNSAIALNSQNFKEFKNNWKIISALQINEIDTLGFEQRDEIINGNIDLIKPGLNESNQEFSKRLAMILNIYLTGFKERILPLNQLVES